MTTKYQTREDYKGMCEACDKRQICKKPCAEVMAILRKDNSTPFYEIYGTGKDDQKIIKILSPPTRPCDNETNFYDEDAVNSYLDMVADETDSPFWDNYQPKLNQTHVFIEHFFNKKPFEEIANDLDVQLCTVRYEYRNACKQMVEAIKYADDKTKSLKTLNAIKKGSRFDSLPKGQRYFILNAVCGLSAAEIAEIEGANRTTVYRLISKCRDRLMTGDLVFLDPNDEEVKAARERIEKERKHARKYYKKNKVA